MFLKKQDTESNDKKRLVTIFVQMFGSILTFFFNRCLKHRRLYMTDSALAPVAKKSPL